MSSDLKISHKIFAVYDSKSESYLMPPQYCTTAGMAIRQFTNVCNDSRDNDVAKYPADFTLFEIGEYSEHTGMHHSHSAHINLGNAVQYQTDQVDNVENITNVS